GVALLTGLTFVSYFSPIRALITDLLSFQLSLTAAAWIVFFTLAIYINAGWLREQECLFMCPYARFQSVMFDRDTLIVSYDAARGEPRGARKKDSERSLSQTKTGDALGDCIDCRICVQVCPTGIDIRDGLQYQCINCALCIDACDSVMDKMGYARGLISYTTESVLAGNKVQWLRPRLIGYASGVMIMLGLFAYTVIARVPLHVDAIRERGQLYRQTSDGLIENIYTLKLLNFDEAPHTFRIRV